jgi:glycosyltransferase involved in cell wall biosynthesis
LDSIQKQTYKNLEVIVVDDGSNTKFSINLPIQFLSQEHKGAPAARNRGLELAKGEYVIFWDADVMGEPEMLDRLKAQLDKHSEASYAYSNYQLPITNFQKKIRAKNFNVENLQKNNFIHSTSLVRRKDAIEWDESLKRFQDWDLWLTMAELGKIGVWVDEYLFKIIAQGTISRWLPSFCYKKPFCWLPWVSKLVRNYEEAKKLIYKKHVV